MQDENINSLFEQYYNEYVGYIKQYCYYKLGDYPDYAEDCVQDTFRVLFEKLSKDAEFKYVKAFLIKTASNFVNLKYRDIGRYKNRKISIDGEEIDIPYNQNFFETDEETIIKLKNKILNSLSREERDLLEKTCRDYRNAYKTTKELAAEYNCSETNIRQKIFVLRKKIKTLVKEETKNL